MIRPPCPFVLALREVLHSRCMETASAHHRRSAANGEMKMPAAALTTFSLVLHHRILSQNLKNNSNDIPYYVSIIPHGEVTCFLAFRQLAATSELYHLQNLIALARSPPRN
eukprot:6177482-Pleurochrysis_carterae.AAC.1